MVNSFDRSLKDGACCALELAARRGPEALEAAWQRFTPRQRGLIAPAFLETLRHECAVRAGQETGDQL